MLEKIFIHALLTYIQHNQGFKAENVTKCSLFVWYYLKYSLYYYNNKIHTLKTLALFLAVTYLHVQVYVSASFATRT